MGNKVLAVTTLKDVNPFAWKPGQSVVGKAEIAFPHQSQATKLALGVFSDGGLANPDIQLGVDGGTKQNWYVLTDMPRQPPAETK